MSSKDTKWDKGDFTKSKTPSDSDRKNISDYYQSGLKTGKSSEDLLEDLEKLYGRSPRQIQRYLAQIQTNERQMAHGKLFPEILEPDQTSWSPSMRRCQDVTSQVANVNYLIACLLDLTWQREQRARIILTGLIKHEATEFMSFYIQQKLDINQRNKVLMELHRFYNLSLTDSEDDLSIRNNIGYFIARYSPSEFKNDITLWFERDHPYVQMGIMDGLCDSNCLILADEFVQRYDPLVSNNVNNVLDVHVGTSLTYYSDQDPKGHPFDIETINADQTIRAVTRSLEMGPSPRTLSKLYTLKAVTNRITNVYVDKQGLRDKLIFLESKSGNNGWLTRRIVDLINDCCRNLN